MLRWVARGVLGEGKDGLCEHHGLTAVSDCRPHTLPPTRLYLAHLAPYLAETEIELQAELKQIQAENEGLAQGLQGQREEVERLVEGLETVVRDLESANEAMDGVVEGEDMRKDLGEMEEELRDLGREREMKL